MNKILFFLLFTSFSLAAQSTLPIDTTNGWVLSWNDEFDYPDAKLEDNWIAQNAASGGVVLCSRWRENAVVHDGILELKAIKESRGGQEWTAASIWTNEKFHYGYYECRYKYAGATGTNNSFWMWPQGVPEGEKAFELDVNEGHYPNIINTNIHNWTDLDEDGGHEDDSERFMMGGLAPQPTYTHVFDASITTSKIRFSSTHGSHFHIGEFRVYAPNTAGYPKDGTSETADKDVSGLVNHCLGRNVTITASGQYTVVARNTDPANVADGMVSSSTWIAQSEGDKWLEVVFAEDVEVGCVQFTNGWKSGNTWAGLIYNYELEYWNGSAWVSFSTFDTANGTDFSEEYHNYGLLWTERNLKFYYDGDLIRTESRPGCISETRIFLSLAILDMGIAGAVTDAIDGTSMKVDYVRHYTIEESADVSKEKRVLFHLSPNPVANSFTLLGVENGTELSIFNIQGVLVMQEIVSEYTVVDVSTLPQGLYLYSLNSQGKLSSGKFLKQ